jgi:hypothetical protein
VASRFIVAAEFADPDVTIANRIVVVLKSNVDIRGMRYVFGECLPGHFTAKTVRGAREFIAVVD